MAQKAPNCHFLVSPIVILLASEHFCHQPRSSAKAWPGTNPCFTQVSLKSFCTRILPKSSSCVGSLPCSMIMFQPALVFHDPKRDTKTCSGILCSGLLFALSDIVLLVTLERGIKDPEVKQQRYPAGADHDHQPLKTHSLFVCHFPCNRATAHSPH